MTNSARADSHSAEQWLTRIGGYRVDRTQAL
jgi:hypothetical protein